jgi:hypothetical protein
MHKQKDSLSSLTQTVAARRVDEMAYAIKDGGARLAAGNRQPPALAVNHVARGAGCSLNDAQVTGGPRAAMK